MPIMTNIKKLTNKSWMDFEKECTNIECILLNIGREHHKAKRHDDNKTYTFFEKVEIKETHIFVDSRGRLNKVISISNVKDFDSNGKKYRVIEAVVEPYENPAGIFKLFNEQSVKDSSKIILSATGDIIVNGEINNNTNITLSVFNNIDINSAWDAIKSDLYNLFDYERFKTLIEYIDEIKYKTPDKDSPKERSKFEKFIEISKQIAGPLGVFVGSVLSSFFNGQD